MSRGYIQIVEAHFIGLVLEQGTPVAKKHALQRLCKLYRQGLRLRSPNRIKGSILHALVDPDQKVKRWAFNALAQFGDKVDVPLMRGALQAAQGDEEVFEAGLTALAKILPKEEVVGFLGGIGVEMSPATILALGQQSKSFAEELNDLSLDINRSSEGELRSATLLIGLDKAPENLLSKSHSIGEVLGDLNTHPDKIVAQYSFWATAEHPSLDLGHTRVKPEDFPKLPPNVQSWAYRVLTKSGSVSIKHYDSVVEASDSPFPEVREGLAIGIRDIFYDSLDTTVVDWYVDETDPVIRDRLLEHMAAHASQVSFYKDEVLGNYRASAPNSELRARLEAANQDETLALEMRKIALRSEEPQLWDAIKEESMGNTQNFFGPVSAGAISNSGNSSSGNVTISSDGEAAAAMTELLKELLQRLEATSAPSGSEVAVSMTKEAIAEPTKGRFQKVVDWLKNVKEAGEATSSLTNLGVEFYTKAAPLLTYFGM